MREIARERERRSGQERDGHNKERTYHQRRISYTHHERESNAQQRTKKGRDCRRDNRTSRPRTPSALFSALSALSSFTRPAKGRYSPTAHLVLAICTIALPLTPLPHAFPHPLSPPTPTQVYQDGGGGGNSYFRAQALGTTVSWTSEAIDIACWRNISLSASLAAQQPLSGILRFLHALDGGAPRLLQAFPNGAGLGALGEVDLAAAIDAGNATTLRLDAQVQLAGGGGGGGGSAGFFAFDDVTVHALAAAPTDAVWGAWQPQSEWGPWGEWAPEACNVEQQQQRNRTRTRVCQPPACGGDALCDSGSPPGTAQTELQFDRRARTAEENCCGPVAGTWSDWETSSETPWSAWAPPQCGVAQVRTQSLRFERTCTPPKCGGANCIGPASFTSTSSQSRTAAENCCAVDGGWTAWAASAWTPWTAYDPPGCGRNQSRVRARVRTRACDNPTPTCGGSRCPGANSELERDVDQRSAEINCCAVDGAWSAWSSGAWSAWSSFLPQQCGQIQTRQRLREKTRSCTRPSPSCGGDSCAGTDVGTDSQTETRSAEENCCPRDGGWGDWIYGSWQAWSSWSPSQCGVAQARQRFRSNQRLCTRPAPSCGGRPCSGEGQELESETQSRTAAEACCAVDGGLTAWSAGDWSPWSPFSPSRCGVEQQSQRSRALTRNCTEPAPACGGAACVGDTRLVVTENATRSAAENCCPVDGGFSDFSWSGDWSPWTAWEPEAACGVEQTRLRFRQQDRYCDSPAPSCGGAACQGNSVNLVEDRETRRINQTRDGQWGPLQPAGPWSAFTAFSPVDVCDGEQRRSRSRPATRTCHPPQCGGMDCVGDAEGVIVEWNNRTVDGPLDAAWSAWEPAGEWSLWGAFSPAECGVTQRRTRQRNLTRECVPPACGGGACPAGPAARLDFEEEVRSAAETCTANCTVDGGYGNWTISAWGPWSDLNTSLCGAEQVCVGRREGGGEGGGGD